LKALTIKINFKRVLCIALFCVSYIGFTQHMHDINATLLEDGKTINIEHQITFFNDSKDTLSSIYLNDWNNAYASKNTALARRFAEEFRKDLHLANNEERGHTNIFTIANENEKFLTWERLDVGDIIKVKLNTTINPYESLSLKILYRVTLPESRFTGYGHTPKQDYNLRYWYLTPVVNRNGTWKLYSNTNLDDSYTYASDYTIKFRFPNTYTISSDLNVVKTETLADEKEVVLKGLKRGDITLFLEQDKSFEHFQNDKLTLITNIGERGLSDIMKAVSVDKIVNFIHDNLGAYPHDNLLVSNLDYRKNPLYGINQLPSFLRPFPEEFQYELKLLKTALKNWLEKTIYIDPRGERWVTDALQNYLMIKYVDEFYPEMKLFGKLSNFFIFKGFHLAKFEFNDQYSFLAMLMARRNQDQPLSTPTDSLVRFNEKIANKYKAGIGLIYLDNYLNGGHVENVIKDFYKNQRSKEITSEIFENSLKKESPKNIDWFFESYVHSNDRIDFKISKTKKVGDSVLVTIKNKTGTNAPITLYGIKKDSIVSKQWLTGILDEDTIKIARNDASRLVLNYDKRIPEYNQRDNWKSLNGFLSSNRKLQFKFFKDAENPYYNQIFYVPSVNFNVDDLLTPGIRLHNKTFLNRAFNFDVEPAYSIGQRTIVGSASFTYRNDLKKPKGKLFRINYSIRGNTFNFADDSRFTTITPSISFDFRTKDLRSNKFSRLNLRHVNVFRTRALDPENNPDYSIFNARYRYSNSGIINFFSWFADFQLTRDFSKAAVSVNYRKLFQNNRQLNLRFFAGKFIFNNTNSDFFSFALDRPTDYLFDFNYLSRSDETGLFSQQIIIAEGGFKSQLDDPFSDDWLVTTNASFNIWRWIEVYGDVGALGRQTGSPRFVYDSGIRLNLLTDYFELYFPLYSNNGFEPSQPDYAQQIRFVVTLSPRTLLGLFTRKWF